ncbi:DNA-binding protein [Solitalea longa]|uniref:DNA-binding protein n=1 Tax=Solitalea longa TaxID=2079460 RepID=A0A2S5A1E8_9SPHI|nr:helix-turn-helix domain-containing protein [Solitalea longa]POY36418.1 DNA-binding protein [Solitalea longa]
MAVEILTKEDLNHFKSELLTEIKSLLKQNQLSKKWLKSPEVRKLLNISPGTLQNFRINGTLPYTKVNGIIFYNYEDIVKILEQKKIHRSNS